MTAKLLTGQHLEFLSLKGVCTGSSESINVKMPNCWKSHVSAQNLFGPFCNAELTVLDSFSKILLRRELNDLLCLCSCSRITIQRCSLNAEKVMHIKGRLLDKAMILFNCVPFQMGTSLKGKNLLPEWVNSLLYEKFFSIESHFYHFKAAYSVTMNIFQKIFFSF